MEAIAKMGLVKPHFARPPKLSTWRKPRADREIYLLDEGDPVPSWMVMRKKPVRNSREKLHRVHGKWVVMPDGKTLVPLFEGGSEMSDFLEGTLVDHMFRTGGFSPAKPTVVAVGLWGGGAPPHLVDASTGATTGESTLGGYDRVDRNPLDANWTAVAAGDGQTDNAAALSFPVASADWDNAPSTDVGITDNSTPGSGNLWLYSPLAAAKTINNGDTAEFAIGALTITFA